MQLQTLQLASDGTRLVAPNLVSAQMLQSSVPWLSLLTVMLILPDMCHPLNLSHFSCNQAGSDHVILLQVRTGVAMVQTEGYAALMSGVSATVARGLFYGGTLSVAPPAASALTYG